MSKQLIVEELVKLLQEQPQKARVWTEGCDCWGEADNVTKDKDEDGEYVLITRSKN